MPPVGNGEGGAVVTCQCVVCQGKLTKLQQVARDALEAIAILERCQLYGPADAAREAFWLLKIDAQEALKDE